MAAIKLFFATYRLWVYLAGIAVVIGGLWWGYNHVLHKGELKERAVWEARVVAQQVRQTRLETELQINNRYLARLAEQAITNRAKVVTREKQIAADHTQRMRDALADVQRLRDAFDLRVPGDSGACEPIVSFANQCIDTATETRAYAIEAFDAAEANGDQVDELLLYIESTCKRWNKELRVTGGCPDYGAEARIKARTQQVPGDP